MLEFSKFCFALLGASLSSLSVDPEPYLVREKELEPGIEPGPKPEHWRELDLLTAQVEPRHDMGYMHADAVAADGLPRCRLF